MSKSNWTRDNLIESIRDVPEWSLTRCILKEGGEVLGDEAGAVAMNLDRDFLSVIGLPSCETVARAIAAATDDATILVQPVALERVRSVTGVYGARAVLHTLKGQNPSISRDPGITVRVLEELPTSLSDTVLKEELSDVFERTEPVSATWIEGEPVAFCYSVGESERYWDVSIDTLASYRRNGFATQAFLHHFGLMRARGLEPVWGAAMSNPASTNMAERLGFEAVAEIWEFELDLSAQ